VCNTDLSDRPDKRWVAMYVDDDGGYGEYFLLCRTWPFGSIFGRPLQVMVRPVLRDRRPVCPVCLSVCNVGVLWPNGWMHQDTTWYGGRPRHRRHCVRWGPSLSPPRKWAQQPPPTFRPMFIVAKRSPVSATVEHLLSVL